jgi:transcriptional regulator with XRE-family HTH domain
MHSDEHERAGYAPSDREGERKARMQAYREAAVAYLKHVSAVTGLSLNQIAERVGVSHTTLTRPVNNPAFKYAPKFAVLQKIAQTFEVSLPEQLTNLPSEAPPKVVGVRPLPVRGIVAAGMWQQIESVQDQFLGAAPVPMMEDLQYAGFAQWMDLIMGPSVNREYPDGTYVHVVDAIAIGYRPSPNDFVIVERRKEQDGLVERTCKKIVFIDGKPQIVGDSTEERFNMPLELASTPDTVVEIVGLVLGGYRPRRR